jgi:hypothetical protein
MSNNSQDTHYLPPREDINSPDMYIPMMALVTYIVLSTLLAGLRGAFHPELLGYTATTAISVMLLEILMIKAGTFILNISSSSQLLDLVAYSGYKFVGVIISLLLSSLCNLLKIGGSSVSWAVFLYCFAANSFFLLRSLRYVLLPRERGQNGGGTPGYPDGGGAPGYPGGSGPAGYPVARGQRRGRNMFLFVYSYPIQFGFMLWLSNV